MNALVFGAGGLLGRALCRALELGGHRLVAPPRTDCDICSEDAVQRVFDDAEPTLVFNAAAYNAVDRAEEEPDVAQRVNAIGPNVLACACRRSGALLVHYSSDFVFDGRQREPYTEDDAPRPLSAYGRSKLDGERAVLDSGARATVIRTAWLFGEGGRNFGSTLVDRLEAGQLVQADTTRVGSPTWVKPLAEQSLLVAERGHTGLFHVVCDGAASWYDVARFVAAELGIDPERVAAIEADLLCLPAERPTFSRLARKRLTELDIDRMPAWQSAMRGHLAERRRAKEAP